MNIYLREWIPGDATMIAQAAVVCVCCVVGNLRSCAGQLFCVPSEFIWKLTFHQINGEKKLSDQNRKADETKRPTDFVLCSVSLVAPVLLWASHSQNWLLLDLCVLRMCDARACVSVCAQIENAEVNKLLCVMKYARSNQMVYIQRWIHWWRRAYHQMNW